MSNTDWGSAGQPGFTRDPGNEQTIPLAPGATFTGQWKRVDNAESFLILYGTHVPFVLKIQWSKDGIIQDTDPFSVTSPQVRNMLGLYSVISPQSTFFRPYYRIVVINGPSQQLFVVSDCLLLKTVFPGYDISVDGPIPVLGLAKLGIGLNWAKMPAGSSHSWEPVQLTALKNQKIALAENLLGNLPVTVANFPANLPVTVANFPATQPVTVSNFPVVVSSYFNSSSAITKTLKSGPGVLRSVIFNSVTSAASLTLFDSLTAAAPKIAVIAVASSFNSPLVLRYDLKFNTGLTIVKTSINDVTIVYD